MNVQQTKKESKEHLNLNLLHIRIRYIFTHDAPET